MFLILSQIILLAYPQRNCAQDRCLCSACGLILFWLISQPECQILEISEIFSSLLYNSKCLLFAVRIYSFPFHATPLFINHLPQRAYSITGGQCFSILSFNLIVTVTVIKITGKAIINMALFVVLMVL